MSVPFTFRSELRLVAVVLVGVTCWLGEIVRAESAPTRFGARVFVDTSGSMRGFFGATSGSKGDSLVAVHAEIDGALAELGLGSSEKCTVGTTIRCTDSTKKERALSASLYADSGSRLDLVLLRGRPPDRIDPNNTPPMDLLDEAKVSLLVTDGMQAAAQGGGDGSCARGADPACIRSALEARIAEGFGLWLVSLRLPFFGPHYPERPIVEAYLTQTKAHISELKFDVMNLGVAFDVTGLTTDKAGNSVYQFRGYKPLLILLVSRDIALGRRLTQSLVRKLSMAPIRPGKMTAAASVRSLEIAPIDPPGLRLTRVEIAPAADQGGVPPAALAEFRVEGSAQIAAGASSKLWCGPDGRGLLYVRYDTLDKGALLDQFGASVQLVSDKSSAGAVARSESRGAGKIRTGVNCSKLPKGRSEVRLRLETQLSFDAAAASREAWWSNSGWSSEDTWKMPERVYGLEEIVLPLLKARANRLAKWGTVTIHVQRD